MSHTGKLLCASLVLLAFPFPCAHADDFDTWQEFGYETYPVRPRPGFHAVERLGITVGGDTISRITYPDGTVREISAGSLYQVGLGALYQWDVVPVSAALTLNYQYDADYNNNDNAAFRRNPLEALAYFNGLDPFRIGAGIRQVYAARATSTINGVSERITYDNARGHIVEIGYQVTPYGWVNLRYVRETYKVATYTTTGASSSVNTQYNGSHVGLFISYEY